MKNDNQEIKIIQFTTKTISYVMDITLKFTNIAVRRFYMRFIEVIAFFIFFILSCNNTWVIFQYVTCNLII